MIQVNSIKRLIAATSDFGNSTKVMEEQNRRTQERLNRGIDIYGNAFAPFKDPKATHLNRRPLENAAMLFDNPKYSLSKTLDGAEFTSTIVGQAAKIAIYQNFKRRFIGYSRIDRDEVREELKGMIVEAFKAWR